MEIVVVLLVISCFGFSEVMYHRHVSPGGARHFDEFADKLSREGLVRVFDARDGTLMEFTGSPSDYGVISIPSSSPRYYFDEKRTFVGWVRDPGDMEIPERFQPIGEAKLISFEEAKVRIYGRDK